MNQRFTIQDILNETSNPSQMTSIERELSLEELIAVHGGSGGGGGSWSNSSDFRDGAMQLAGAIVGLVGAGVAIATAPISVPVAVGVAIVTGAGLAVAAADAQIDMQNASPDASY